MTPICTIAGYCPGFLIHTGKTLADIDPEAARFYEALGDTKLTGELHGAIGDMYTQYLDIPESIVSRGDFKPLETAYRNYEANATVANAAAFLDEAGRVQAKAVSSGYSIESPYSRVDAAIEADFAARQGAAADMGTAATDISANATDLGATATDIGASAADIGANAKGYVDSAGGAGDNGNVHGYNHNPMDNPEAAKDIVENPDAVYGFSPKPGSSLDEYATLIDWENIEQVAKARAERIDYHKHLEIEEMRLSEKVGELSEKGYSIEDIASLIVNERNQNRIQTYMENGNYKGLEAMQARNMKKYNNPDGPTAAFLFSKYGSWEEVIFASVRSNLGMDACTGLYDLYYGGNKNAE